VEAANPTTEGSVASRLVNQFRFGRPKKPEERQSKELWWQNSENGAKGGVAAPEESESNVDALMKDFDFEAPEPFEFDFDELSPTRFEFEKSHKDEFPRFSLSEDKEQELFQIEAHESDFESNEQDPDLDKLLEEWRRDKKKNTKMRGGAVMEAGDDGSERSDTSYLAELFHPKNKHRLIPSHRIAKPERENANSVTLSSNQSIDLDSENRVLEHLRKPKSAPKTRAKQRVNKQPPNLPRSDLLIQSQPTTQIDPETQCAQEKSAVSAKKNRNERRCD